MRTRRYLDLCNALVIDNASMTNVKVRKLKKHRITTTHAEINHPAS
ncbi:unnamed protein product [Schistosoma margrebowiei]|uniref:Uncharacterized protein n=1 Tax=Schistosoma margrebowiei TaxID=48269 RepID=A0A3P8D3F9_9TREM|nr:unnamed protein product [Schistosoma margrebowiei]